MVRRLFVAAVLAAVVSSAAFSAAKPAKKAPANNEPYPVVVTIANQSKLPPARLADALYAKASVLGDSEDLLREAAKLNPKDPVYYYRLAMAQMPGSVMPTATGDSKVDADIAVRIAQDAANARTNLGRALAIDPNYLPALYAKAVTEPTLEARLKAFGAVAEIDKDNPEPYYVMAMVRYDAAREGLLPTEESGLNAYDIRADEWAAIQDLLEKGNSRGPVVVNLARIPSFRDVTVTTKGKLWPAKALDNIAPLQLDETDMSLFGNVPTDVASFAMARQLARQAWWEATKFDKAGKKTEALKTLAITHDFADKFASQEPRRLLTFLVASAVHHIAWTAETDILKRANDTGALVQINDRKALWQKVICEDGQALVKSSVTVKGVMISPKEPLMYPDLAAESAGVTKMLEKLGLNGQ